MSARPVSTYAVMIAVFAAFGAIAVQGRDLRVDRNEQRRVDAVLTASRAFAEALTSVDGATASRDIDNVLRLSTGAFKSQFASQRRRFGAQVEDSKYSSTGRVVEIGVISSKAENAVTLVAASAVITGPKSPKGQKRGYRMRLTLVQEDERWLVSKVELVA